MVILLIAILNPTKVRLLTGMLTAQINVAILFKNRIFSA